MIGHFNLLDKVWYLNNTQINEVTIVSKEYTDSFTLKDQINVVLHNELLEVNRKQLFYTLEEVLKDALDAINSSISKKEKYLENQRKELKELYDLRNTMQHQLECEL